MSKNLLAYCILGLIFTQ